MTDRYQVGNAEGQFEAGSGDKVLANKLGIVDPDEMDDLESRLLEDLYESVLRRDFPDRRLWVADLKTWHRRWLGNVYSWAGEERSVNLTQGRFPLRGRRPNRIPVGGIRGRMPGRVDALSWPG